MSVTPRIINPLLHMNHIALNGLGETPVTAAEWAAFFKMNEKYQHDAKSFRGKEREMMRNYYLFNNPTTFSRRIFDSIKKYGIMGMTQSNPTVTMPNSNVRAIYTLGAQTFRKNVGNGYSWDVIDRLILGARYVRPDGSYANVTLNDDVTLEDIIPAYRPAKDRGNFFKQIKTFVKSAGSDFDDLVHDPALWKTLAVAVGAPLLTTQVIMPALAVQPATAAAAAPIVKAAPAVAAAAPVTAAPVAAAAAAPAIAPVTAAAPVISAPAISAGGAATAGGAVSAAAGGASLIKSAVDTAAPVADLVTKAAPIIPLVTSGGSGGSAGAQSGTVPAPMPSLPMDMHYDMNPVQAPAASVPSYLIPLGVIGLGALFLMLK